MPFFFFDGNDVEENLKGINVSEKKININTQEPNLDVREPAFNQTLRKSNKNK